MVLNPYKQSKPSLPISIPTTATSQSWLFNLLNCLCCGLLAKRAGFYYLSLRFIILLLILGITLISYYFHMHFTHPTLLSESFPKVMGKYDLARFKPNHLFKDISNGSNNGSSKSLRIRLNKDFADPIVLSQQEKEGLAQKDPLAYNPNHFHRHREPLKEEPEQEGNRVNEPQPSTDTIVEDEQKPASPPKVKRSDVKTIIEEAKSPPPPPSPPPLPSKSSETIQAPNDSIPSLPNASKLLNTLKFNPSNLKLSDVVLNSTTSSDRPTAHENQSIHLNTNSTQRAVKQQIAVISDHPTNSSSLHHQGVKNGDSTETSSLKHKLLEKLKQMKAQHPINPPDTIAHQSPPSAAIAAIHLATHTNPDSVPSPPTPQLQINQNVNISTVQKSSTKYDLPSDLVERLKENHKHEIEIAQHQEIIGGDQETTGEKSKIDYCEKQIDPFEKVPVDRFTPPKGASFESVTIWKKKMNEFLKSVSKLKIGGAALREKLTNDVTELKILRFQLFCKYA